MMRVAERIDAHLGEPFIMNLNREFERGCCGACRALIDAPVPGDVAPPERDADRLMREAAKTRKCIPARERWRVDPELKRNLEALYVLYVSGLIGPCPQHVRERIDVTIIAASADMRLWWELTRDGMFLDRINQAYEPYRGRVPFAQFRDVLLKTCVERDVTDVNGALTVLETQTPPFAADWLN